MRPASKVEQQDDRVDEESHRKSPFLPKTPTLKTIQSASQLKVEGKLQLQLFENFISSKEFIFATGHDKAFLLAVVRDMFLPEPNFVIFMQFSGKNWPNNRQAPFLRNSGFTTHLYFPD